MRSIPLLSSVTAASLALALAAGCSSGGSGGGGSVSSSATGGSGGSATAPAGSGPLAQKAYAFEQVMAARHTPDGLAANLVLDPSGAVQFYEEIEDSTIWTGVHIASEALRYRVTQEPQALAEVERSLRAFHTLQEVAGDPGYVPRGFAPAGMVHGGVPAAGPLAGRNYVYFDSTSRDQYAGMMLGYALSWPIIADPALRAQVQQDVRAIGERLMRDDMKMRRLDASGQWVTEFAADPTYAYQDTITPQTWATVDDFPINLIAQSVPYDPQLAAALANLKLPPIRGGEAMHGLAFIRVAGMITGDPAFDAYYRSVLIGQRSYLTAAVEYGSFQDDVLHGRDLQKVEAVLLALNHELTNVVQAYLQAKYGQLSWIAAYGIQVVMDTILKNVADAITDTITFLSQPNAQQRVVTGQVAVGLLAQLFDALGEHGVAQSLRSIASGVNPLATSTLADLANTLRSYVGEDLCHISAYTLLSVETDPVIHAQYATALDRRGDYVGDEKNAWFDFVEAAYSASPNPQRIAEGKAALLAHPVDLTDRVFDHTGEPGVIPSPWPDRFGKVGNIALGLFTVDQRAPHLMMWHQHPREIKTGSSYPGVKAPVGYLAAYWLGRYHGYISAAE